jgi:hypothetical protein
MNSQGIKNPVIGNIGNPGDSGGSFFQKALPAAVGLAFLIGTIIFFFVLITGAIQWISSGGDKQALEGARGKISNALIGLLILFATFAIIRLIQRFFGIQILTLDIGPLVIR